MKRKISTSVLFISLLTIFTSVNAQQTYHRCTAMEYLQEQQQLDPDLAHRMELIEQHTQQYLQNNHSASRAVVTIPVVVHVVYNTAAQNISDALVQAQINQLNQDFARLNSDASSTPSAFAGLAANTNVQFCLAQRDPNGNPTTGIVRKATSTTSFSSNNGVKSSSTGGDNAWDATKYLNIWSCNLSGGLLGYAQFPGGSVSTDGVVVLYSSVGSLTTPGTASPYNFGRTATHEVGHWLNLYHIWGDDGTSCSGSDQVGDTPNQSDENYGCPAYPLTDNCSPSSPGVMFMNYMDYTDDACMNMFSAGQASRMNALFATGGARVGLLTSLGCTPPSTSSCGTPSGLTTTAIANTTATFNWSAVSGAVSYNVQYRVSGGTTWSTGSSSASSYNATGLTAGVAYEWQVQAVCASESSAFTLSATFTTTGGASCTDAYESNNTSGTAKVIAQNTDITALISNSADNDYFKFTTVKPNTNVRVTLTNLPADYDVKLYNSNLATLATGQNSGTTSESIKRNTKSAATYYVRVYGYNGAFNATQCYTLRVSTSSTAFKTTGAGEPEETTDKEILVEQVAALNLYPNPAQDNLNVEFISDFTGSAQVNVFNLMGQKVLSAEKEVTEGMNTLNLNTTVLSKGNYIFEILNNGGATRQRFVIAR